MESRSLYDTWLKSSCYSQFRYISLIRSSIIVRLASSRIHCELDFRATTSVNFLLLKITYIFIINFIITFRSARQTASASRRWTNQIHSTLKMCSDEAGVEFEFSRVEMIIKRCTYTFFLCDGTEVRKNVTAKAIADAKDWRSSVMMQLREEHALARVTSTNIICIPLMHEWWLVRLMIIIVSQRAIKQFLRGHRWLHRA